MCRGERAGGTVLPSAMLESLLSAVRAVYAENGGSKMAAEELLPALVGAAVRVTVRVAHPLPQPFQ